jgi:hypothetical protein
MNIALNIEGFKERFIKSKTLTVEEIEKIAEIINSPQN